jgi:hypothetical protein
MILYIRITNIFKHNSITEINYHKNNKTYRNESFFYKRNTKSHIPYSSWVNLLDEFAELTHNPAKPFKKIDHSIFKSLKK